jgi:nucleoid DNA-binding protein
MALNKKFFDNISGRCGYVDPESVKAMYYGMVKEILDELVDKGSISLPHWGTFKVTQKKERNIRDVNSGNIIKIPKKKSVVFLASKRLKYYIQNKDIDGVT